MQTTTTKYTGQKIALIWAMMVKEKSMRRNPIQEQEACEWKTRIEHSGTTIRKPVQHSCLSGAATDKPGHPVGIPIS